MKGTAHIPWRGKPSEGQLVVFLHGVLGELERMMMRNAYVILGDWHLAEDVFQETLLALCMALRKGKLKGDVRPWCWRVTRNIAISHARRGEEWAELLHVEMGGLSDVSDMRRNAPELARRALSGLAALPRQQKRALKLVYVDGLSQEEAARQMGCSHSSLRTHLRRGRQILKKRLKKAK